MFFMVFPILLLWLKLRLGSSRQLIHFGGSLSEFKFSSSSFVLWHLAGRLSVHLCGVNLFVALAQAAIGSSHG